MSIKLMSQVWDSAKVKGSELLVLLALADFANDDGSSIYPSMKTLADKSRLSEDQARRVVHKLIEMGIVELVEQGGWVGKRNRSNEYRIVMQPPCNLQAPRADAGTPHAQNMQESGGGTRADASTVLAPMQEDPPLEPSLQQREEKEETHAPEPLAVAWRQAYTDVPMPPALQASLANLVTECGMAATIHGIKASALKDGGRNFKYIAECARNYVPPPPKASYANGNPYTVGVPGVVELPALKQTVPPLPKPMPTDDPWAIALAELIPTFAATSAAHWLQGSRLQENGEIAGEPFYRIVLTTPGADAGWMTQQAEPAIRKKLAGILGKRISIDIIVAEGAVA